MHTKVLKIPFVRCLVLLGALLTALTTFAQAAFSGRTPSIHTLNHTGAATIQLGETLCLNSSVGDTTELTVKPGIGGVNGLLVVAVSSQGTLAFDPSATGAISAP